jgi:hypothetical protein
MENLNEHLRRVHTNPDGAGNTPPPDMVLSDENDSEQTGMKRKRLRDENEKLKADMQQQSTHSLSMMAQIAELQDALREGLGHHGLGAPTAQMI